MPRTRKQTASQKTKVNISLPKNKKRARKINKILGVLILLLGLILFAFPTVYKNFTALKISKDSITPQRILTRSTNTNAIKTNTEPIKIDVKLLSNKEQFEPPSRIIIPGLKIDLPIVEAKVVNGLWELSETSASHGVGSANPGEFGNTVVFAHARDELFGPLRNIKQGNIIYILTKDRWHKYEVKQTKLVEPNEVQVIAPTPDETLTLYTCDGFLDSKRLIIVAKPQK